VLTSEVAEYFAITVTVAHMVELMMGATCHAPSDEWTMKAVKMYITCMLWVQWLPVPVQCATVGNVHAEKRQLHTN